VSALHCKV